MAKISGSSGKKGNENTPYINLGKGDTLAQRAVSLPHQRVRGKLVWVWWVSGSMRPQGTRMSVFVFNGRGKFVCTLHRMDMEISCKLGRPGFSWWISFGDGALSLFKNDFMNRAGSSRSRLPPSRRTNRQAQSRLDS